MNPFQDACGATGPLLLTVEGPGSPAGDPLVYDQPFLLVGRDPRCDLRLDHPDVSDRHAYLQVVDGRLVCLDLGSRTGVYQGGRRGRLIDLDRDRPIRIGPFRLRLVGGVLGRPVPDTRDTVPRPAKLELSHRSLRQTAADLPPGLALVGSGDCPIRLVDPSVSNYHASLVRTPGGVWVVDLLGDGGVRLNGETVTSARLDPGDALELGHSSIRLLDPTPAPPVEPEPAPAVAQPVPPVPSTLPAPIVGADDADASGTAVVPLTGAWALIRQEMLDEFRRARDDLLDTYTALQREHSGAVQAELEELREVGRDLRALRADLERQTRLLAERLSQPAATVPPPPTAPTSAPAPSVVGLPARLGSAASTAPRTPTYTNGNGNGHGHHVLVREPRFNDPATWPSDPSESDLGPFGPDDSDLGDPSPPEPSRPERPQPAPADSDEDIHARLCDRIAKIHDAEQSRWRRLLNRFQKPQG